MSHVKVFKMETNNNLETAAISAEESTILEEKGCVVPPVDFGFLAELFHENSWHERCLRVKSKVIAGLGYSLKNEKVSQDLQKKIRKPNKEDSFVQMLTKLETDYNYLGNAYLEIVRLGNKVERIYHIPARDIRVMKDKTGFYQLAKNGLGEAVFFDNFGTIGKNHELIHFKNYTPLSSYYGLPEYLGCVPAITTVKLITEFNIRFFANAAMPDLAIIVEGGELEKKDEDAIIEKIKTNMVGNLNAHRTLFLSVNSKDVKVRIEKLNEVKDGSFKILKDSSRDEIVSAHGVPPRLLSIVVNGALGGTNESMGQLETFLEIDVKPRQSVLTEQLNQMYEEMYGINPDFYLHELEIRTYADKINSSATAVSNGIITTDEAREEIGYAPMTDNAIINTFKQIRKNYAG